MPARFSFSCGPPYFLANSATTEISLTISRSTRVQVAVTVFEWSQKPIRVETCNGPLCAGKQASEYSGKVTFIQTLAV